MDSGALYVCCRVLFNNLSHKSDPTDFNIEYFLTLSLTLGLGDYHLAEVDYSGARVLINNSSNMQRFIYRTVFYVLSAMAASFKIVHSQNVLI